MLLQRLGPALQRGAGGGTELRRETAQLRLHRVTHALVQARGLARNGRHGVLHHRLERFTGNARAGRQGFVERSRHRLTEFLVGHAGFAVEQRLALQQLVVELLTPALHLRHQGLQLVHHRGQGAGLLLQRLEGFVALVRE
ncbi:hypothetical protein D9M70_596390 [compost metagenome]